MKPEKIKRYRLGISRNFPTTHPRAGQPTNFVEKIKNNLCLWKGLESTRLLSITEFGLKLHTIRANYPLWEKRMKEVQEGRAVIELFYWSGKPYNSPQVVFATLDKDSGCGVQRLIFAQNHIANGVFHAIVSTECGLTVVNEYDISKNDGLSLDDFKAWFKKYDLSQPMAIIHFTSFRY